MKNIITRHFHLVPITSLFGIQNSFYHTHHFPDTARIFFLVVSLILSNTLSRDCVFVYSSFFYFQVWPSIFLLRKKLSRSILNVHTLYISIYTDVLGIYNLNRTVSKNGNGALFLPQRRGAVKQTRAIVKCRFKRSTTMK